MRAISIAELLEAKKHITIDIVGDSITQGTNHCTLEETYIAQYAKLLADKYPEATVRRYDGIVTGALEPLAGFSEAVIVNKGSGELCIDVLKNGIGGNTVRRALNRIQDYTGELANGRHADVTVFMFGINDALKSDSEKYVTAEKFKEDYRELIQRFRETETSEIVIMSATTNDQCIDAHVEATAELAEENGFVYVDQFRVWQEHYDPKQPHFGHGDWLSDLPYDACHPTPKGARVIAGTLFEKVN